MQTAVLSEFYDRVQSVLKEENERTDPEDLEYVRRVDFVSGVYEALGRFLIHFSLDPFTWSAGVGILSLHFIQEWNLSHVVVHKTYDSFPNAKKYHFKTARSWSIHIAKFPGMRGHMSHHSHTTVIGRDADFSHHGWDRLSDKVKWKPHHLIQFPLGILAFPFSMWAQNIHYAGFTDFFNKDGSKHIFIKEKSREEFIQAVKNFGEGFLPYFAYNYIFYPALAGPFFMKVVAGNFCSELLCNIWMACVNLGNHLGGDVELLLPEEEPKDRKQYLLKTIRCCNDFPLPRILDFHTGGLNYHLAHHLAPKLPPNRLKKLTHKIQNLCEEYKVPYNSKGFIRSSATSLGKLLYYALPLKRNKLSS